MSEEPRFSVDVEPPSDARWDKLEQRLMAARARDVSQPTPAPSRSWRPMVGVALAAAALAVVATRLLTPVAPLDSAPAGAGAPLGANGGALPQCWPAVTLARAPAWETSTVPWRTSTETSPSAGRWTAKRVPTTRTVTSPASTRNGGRAPRGATSQSTSPCARVTTMPPVG